MAKIYIDKTIFVRDKFRVKRQAFFAGTEVEESEYYAVLSKNSVLNPQDLPKDPRNPAKRSLASKPVEEFARTASVETKDLEVVPEKTEPEKAETKPAPKEVVVASEPLGEKPTAKRGRPPKDEST